jgi:hypothetical protein
MHLVHTVLALHPLSSVLQTTHWDSFFSWSFLSPRGPQGSSIPVLSFSANHSSLKLSIMDTVVLGFQFARPLVVFLAENIPIQHHPCYDVESYLF